MFFEVVFSIEKTDGGNPGVWAPNSVVAEEYGSTSRPVNSISISGLLTPSHLSGKN